MRLTIIIPVFNEDRTIGTLIERLQRISNKDFEWIFVDDGSTDGTTNLLRTNVQDPHKLIVQRKNQGKTAAILAGLEQATGDWVIIQDADLEYDPSEIPGLLQVACKSPRWPLAIYGKRPSYWWNPRRWIFAGGVLGVDMLLWVHYGGWVRDHATCYKLMPTKLLRSLDLRSSGFEGCIEITAKLMRMKVPIKQVGITYHPRSVQEGKKLTIGYAKEAWRAVHQFRNWKPSQGAN